jgi:hypothetical protein
MQWGTNHPDVFAPFAGTEGYNPVAYIPYIAAAALGHVVGLNFPNTYGGEQWRR